MLAPLANFYYYFDLGGLFKAVLTRELMPSDAQDNEM